MASVVVKLTYMEAYVGVCYLTNSMKFDVPAIIWRHKTKSFSPAVAARSCLVNKYFSVIAVFR
jgi:hypothetical protein